VRGVLLVVLVALLGLPAPAQSGRTELPAAGGAGAGDAYFPLDGNGGIDVEHYAVRVRYAPGRASRLVGRTALTVVATQALSSFSLDLLLPVRAVRVNGAPAGWHKPNRHELRITPPRPLAVGETFRVTVTYAGRPARIGWAGERNWLDDGSEALAVNQPHIAAWWFPANDHPSDRAAMDVAVTTPAGLTAVSNGRRVGRSRTGDRVTTRWQAQPMASYLAFLAIGRFEVAQGSRDGRPWLVAVSRELPRAQRARSMRLMKRIPAITAWMEQVLGPYPFDTTGGLTTSLDLGFALENQTRPVFPVMGFGGLSVVVHEVAHQWFGDSVTVDRWREIWLNEGFATFLEWHWAETHGGARASDRLRREHAVRDSSFWTVPILDPGPGRLFDPRVYDRGAMTLQALRNRLGEGAFWQVLRSWAAERGGRTGSTEQLVGLAERISGQELDGFFRAWLSDPTRPAATAENGLG
jgi:aminopeptidase N